MRIAFLALLLLGVVGCGQINGDPKFEQWLSDDAPALSCYETTRNYNFNTVAVVTIGQTVYTLEAAYYFCAHGKMARVAQFTTGRYVCMSGECKKIIKEVTL